MAEDTKKQPEDKKEDTTPEEVSEPKSEETKNPEIVSAEESTKKDIDEKKVEEEAVVEEEAIEDKKAESTEEDTKEEEPKKAEIPDFRVGDSIKLLYRIIEGEKTRLQPFEGIVISKRGEGVSKTFTVRRIGADKVGVERIFPLFSPNIEKLEVVKKGKVRRAKLYYLRGKIGREAMRIKERK